MTCAEDTSRARRQIACTSNVDIKSQRKLERGGETRPQNLSRFSEKEKTLQKNLHEICAKGILTIFGQFCLSCAGAKYRKVEEAEGSSPLLIAPCKISIKDLQQPKISRFCKS